MYTDNPYIEDYYFTMYTRRRANLPLPVPMLQPPKAEVGEDALPSSAARPGERTGIVFESTLGGINYSNIRTPRTLISMQGLVAVAGAETIKNQWIDTRRHLEAGYSALLRVCDVDRLAENPASDRRCSNPLTVPPIRYSNCTSQYSEPCSRSLFEQRKSALSVTMAALGLDSAPELERFENALTIIKGVLKLLFPSPLVLTSLCW